jgi:predicted transcriptional regulator
MKNTHISEIISQNKLTILSDQDTLNTFLSLDKKNSANCYVVNNQNVLKGVVNEKTVLQFISPMLPLLDQQNNSSFMKKLGNVPLSSLINKSFKTLTMKNSLSDVLQDLTNTSQDALAVVNGEGKLMGEVTINSVLNSLGSKNMFQENKRENVLQAV